MEEFVDQTKTLVEAEAKEPNLPRRRLEGQRVMVRHGDVKGRALHVLGPCRAADSAVGVQRISALRERVRVLRGTDRLIAPPA